MKYNRVDINEEKRKIEEQINKINKQIQATILKLQVLIKKINEIGMIPDFFEKQSNDTGQSARLHRRHSQECSPNSPRLKTPLPTEGFP